MIKKRTLNQFFPIALLVFLVACGKQAIALPPETSTPTAASPTLIPTSTLTAVTMIPSPLPTEPIIPVITPDPIQVERWKEYQTELAKFVLSDSGAEFPLYKDALCEWDILGRSGQELYVWAVCARPGSLGEKPAVIYLETDGSIRDVKVVFHGSSWGSTIRELFPADVQEKIYLYSSSSPFSGRPLDMRVHLEYRLKHPEEAPLIVLSAMSIDTPTP
jgi:hypothetical protein